MKTKITLYALGGIVPQYSLTLPNGDQHSVSGGTDGSDAEALKAARELLAKIAPDVDVDDKVNHEFWKF